MPGAGPPTSMKREAICMRPAAPTCETLIHILIICCSPSLYLEEGSTSPNLWSGFFFPLPFILIFINAVLSYFFHLWINSRFIHVLRIILKLLSPSSLVTTILLSVSTRFFGCLLLSVFYCTYMCITQTLSIFLVLVYLTGKEFYLLKHIFLDYC